jgi:porphobilinogen synthase
MLDRTRSSPTQSSATVGRPRRLQRLRRTAPLRDLVAEIGFTRGQLIQPLFLAEALATDEPIAGLPNNFRHAAKSLLERFERDLEAGVRQFLLFPVPQHKASSRFVVDFAAECICKMRARAGSDVSIWVDTCLCSFTSSGHCCLHRADGEQDLPATLAALTALGLQYAAAGADGIAPSDMNDGRVAALRAVLDEAGHGLTAIMSYSAKFASHLYGPFRNAASSAPQFGDRRSYQLDVRSRRDALASSRRCADEGADLLMVKPGLSSSDLLAPIAQATGLPVGTYQVSGEYASLALLAREGLIDFDGGLLESWYVLRRAGAAFIITYGAREARRLQLSGS